MSLPDWIVLTVTLIGMVGYGLYRSNTTKNLDGYFLGNRAMPWPVIMMSVMGTQASAITFLSVPGQAYADGMRFVQYYFGLPLAMVVLCITFVPIFHRLKIYTAYEYLEQRFDLKTRTLTSLLFLLQRGISTGISIYAPSIILSTLFGWNIYLTNIFMGGVLIIYTVTGGARAVAYTQTLQFIIILTGMVLAAIVVVRLLPPGVGLLDSLKVSGKLGKLNVITTGSKSGGFDWTDRYNMWSGIIGGFFLALSYFGTDQSQVGRYLTASSITESRLGLLMNGLVKVPMQFCILLVGAMIFSFYQFTQPPLFFNQTQIEKVQASPYNKEYEKLQFKYDSLYVRKKLMVNDFVALNKAGMNDSAYARRLKLANQETDKVRSDFKAILQKKDVNGDANDTNYIFLRFVVDHLPEGLVGLLIAVIFLASWGSIAAALNSLSSSTVVDIHKKFINRQCTEKEDYRLSKWYTLFWGVFSMVIAEFAGNIGSLVEAVNILGSLFYGVMLGIFLVAFYFKSVKSNVVFYSALVVELFIILSFAWPGIKDAMPGVVKVLPAFLDSLLNTTSSISWLWLNAIGSLGVVILCLLLQGVVRLRARVSAGGR